MPRTADDRLATALAPLRTRLDMLIEMVARLTYRDIALPPVVPVALSPSRIIWHSRPALAPPAIGSGIGLYFLPNISRGGFASAPSNGLRQGQRDEFWQVEGSLVEMPGSTREGMTRLAFLTHRQQRAWHRSQNMATGET